MCTFVQIKNENNMKKMYFAMLAAGALLLVSCNGGKEDNDQQTYKLDADASELTWSGKYVADGHMNTGTLKITEGTMVYNGDDFVSGDFKVDLRTIESTNLEGETKAKLEGHLKSEDFFNTAENSVALVTVNEVTNDNIRATIKLMGKEIEANMPVKVKKTDNKLTAKGKFDVDFKELELKGFRAAEGDPADARVETVFSFELDLEMKK